MQNAAQEAVHVVLVGSASLLCKASFGERLAHIAVGLVDDASHQHLRAVVYLRYTWQCQEYGERRLQDFHHQGRIGGIRVEVFYETVYVVVVQECHDHRGILV